MTDNKITIRVTSGRLIGLAGLITFVVVAASVADNIVRQVCPGSTYQDFEGCFLDTRAPVQGMGWYRFTNTPLPDVLLQAALAAAAVVVALLVIRFVVSHVRITR